MELLIKLYNNVRPLDEKHPDYSVGTFYSLGMRLISQNRAPEAIPFFLDSMQMDKDWEEKMAQKSLMEVFN